ncbi:MAG: hypothetical protein M1821_008604 [Bathelium mastoideum]|nr:MAG: hypothetical protein M1821_008604 [Bathelium mastoideum]
MRGKRSKQYRKLMQQYGIHFGFREPYQVLLDAQILIDAHHFTMDLPHLLRTALHGTIKPMITHCTLLHLRSLPSSLSGPLLALTRSACELRRCGHHDDPASPLPTRDCLLDCVDAKHAPGEPGAHNKHRYVVATQDEEARKRLRQVPGTPLLYVKRSVLVMEPMAAGSVRVQEQEERGKFRAGLKGGRGVKRKREEEEGEEDERSGGEGEGEGEGEGDGEQEEVTTKKKKRRGPKGPNPLSMLKPKKRAVQNGQRGGEGDMRDEASGNGDDPKVEAETQPKKKRKRKHKSGKVSEASAGATDIAVEE